VWQLVIQSGCIFISGAVEFDDPGPFATPLARPVTWLKTPYQVVVQKSRMPPNTDADEEQMAFEITV
jgi:hypothetical protein